MNALRFFLRKCKHTIFSNMKENLYFREKKRNPVCICNLCTFAACKNDGK